jgi:PAS domain S-box-containing protein
VKRQHRSTPVENISDSLEVKPCEAELHRTAELLSAVAEGTTDAVFVKDRAGKYLFFNEAASRFVGRPIAEVVGKDDTALFDAESARRVMARDREIMEVGRVESAEEHLTAAGITRVYQATKAPYRDATGNVIGLVGISRDITEQKRAEDLRAGEGQVLKLLVAGGNLQDLLAASVRRIEQHAPDMVCSVLLVSSDGTHLCHGAAPNLPDDFNKAVDGLTIGPSAGSCGTAAYRMERVVVLDIASDPLWEGLAYAALPHGLRACWSQPIISTAGKVLGTFAMYYRETRSPSAREIRLIEDAAHLAGMVIERKRAEVALQESERHFKELAERNFRLVREVEHRVRNNLAGLLGLISLLEDKAPDVAAFATGLKGRLTAMAHVHLLLAEAGWKSVSLKMLVESTMSSLAFLACHSGPLTLEGSDVSLGSHQAQALAMVLSELFTNCCKYGSRSIEGGELQITWKVMPADQGTFVRLNWTERNGPPILQAGIPSMGTSLIRGLASHELRGRCVLNFPQQGAEHVMEFPLEETANLPDGGGG